MKMKFLPLALTAFLTVGTVISPITPAARTAQAADTVKKEHNIAHSFKSERAYATVSQLSEKIGPRVAGTAAEKKSALLLAAAFKKQKLDVSVQTFGIPDRLEGALTANGHDIPLRAASGSVPTPNEGLTAPLFDAGLGYPEDFTADSEGKIALISRGELTFYEKAKNAAAAGAKAVIIYNNADSTVPFTPNLSGHTVDIPVVGIKKEDGTALLTQKEATLQLKAFTNQTSQNIIGVRKPKHVKNPGIVYVTAHYDSVPSSPGANDNASGTSVMLEMAQILKKIPSDKEIRFIAFGAEELGLLGSNEYVNRLSEQEAGRSIVNFNLDMVGTSWESATELYVNTVDGASNLVWQSSKAAAGKLGFNHLSLKKGGSSDHVPFHGAGIDSANFIWGDPETGEVEPWYHTPNDSIKHVSKERLQQAGEIVTASLYHVMKKETKHSETKKKKQVEAKDKFEDFK
ncbi:M28 family peptidase [Bacillus atrophaeus]